MTTCPEQPSAVIGKTDGVPVTMNACWICIGAFAVVGDGDRLRGARADREVAEVGLQRADDSVRAVERRGVYGMISGLLRLSLLISSWAWNVPGPFGGLNPTPIPHPLPGPYC